MKTPMQELIERLNNVKPQDFCSIETIKGWAEAMLEKEKEVIMNAWKSGVDYRDNKGHGSTYLEIELREQPNNYYNETFNTKRNEQPNK